MSPAALLIIASLLAPAAAPAEAPAEARPAGEAPPARTDSIGGLLAEPSPATGDREASSTGLLFRMLGWVAALAVAAVAAVRIWRRMVVPAAAGTGAGAVRVVGRAALTPKHVVYMVKVANQRLLLVGVSGDRITALSEFDDPAQVLAVDSSFQRTLEAAGGEGGPEERGAGVPSLDGELTSYRHEVRRLLGVVRGWRGRLGRMTGAAVKAGPGD